MSRPGWLKVLTDTALFALGLLILARQGGVFFDPPPQVSIPILAVGALMCNVPGILQVLAWRTGARTDSSPSVGEPSLSGPPQGSSPARSSAGDA